MNALLNEIVRECGKDALRDAGRLCGYLAEKGADEKYICTLTLVLQYGNIREITERTEGRISCAALNTAIINTVRNTGLKQYVVQDMLFDILSAMGIGFDPETLRGFNTETGETTRIFMRISPADEKKALMLASDDMSSNTAESVARAVNAYSELAKAGSSEAMYMLGVIKRRELLKDKSLLYGRVLTAQERRKELGEIRRLLTAAAANGNVKAKAELGDLLYEENDFSAAYEYYSAPGVVTVKPDTKKRLVSILNQRASNVLLMILGGILLLGMWIFMFVNMRSLHRGSLMIGWGIPVNVAASLVYGFMCYRLQRSRYGDSKLFIVIMTALWMIYPLILAIN